MTIRNLDALLAPQAVVLVGASDRSGTVGGTMVQNLLHSAFRGQVMLVNPSHDSIAGTTCYPDVASLPGRPDLAVIATPFAGVARLIDELGQKGCRAAVVISAGPGGTQEAAWRQSLLNAARPYLIRLLGPNCVGALVPAIGLNAGFAHMSPRAGHIAFLAQSGAVVTSVIDWAVAREVGFSCLLSMGEMADIDFADVIDYLAADQATTSVLLYIETIGNARKFMSAARLAARGKPVIAIKAGRHAGSAQAVVSHTGALAGADAVYDAAFRQAGVLRVYNLEELFSAARTLASAPPVEGNRLAILTNGGGLGILAADALIDRGGQLAKLSSPTLAKLDAVLPPMWSHGNPVDIIGDASAERYGAALDILLEDPASNAVLVLNCPTAVVDCLAVAQAVLNGPHRRKRALLTSWVGEATAARARGLFSANNVPTYDTPESAVTGFMQLADWHRSRIYLMQTPPSVAQGFQAETAAATRVIEGALGEGRQILTSPESRAVFAAYGIRFPELRIARDAAEAAVAAAELGGSVAVKILSPDITHKSDVGGVVLNLRTPETVRHATATMLENVRRIRPQARLDGVMVEAMAERNGRFELIIGVIDDAQFGPVMLFGEGGVAVEQLSDRSLALPPLNLLLARDMIERTRIYRLLRGYRDRPPADLDAIALSLVKLSQLICEQSGIAEAEINPVLAGADGVLALDARIVVRRSAKGDSRLAIRPYPAELESQVTLHDGRRCCLRPIRPEDEPALHRQFSRLSPHTIRMRFFSPVKEFSHAQAAQLTQIDYDREMAFILVDQGPAELAEIHGVVRLSADPDGERGEFAIVIEDRLTNQGLGTLLMRRMLEYAASRGIGEVYGFVLTENESMLDLCRNLGFRIQTKLDSPGIVQVTRAGLRR
jgi:acetyltransferase